MKKGLNTKAGTKPTPRKKPVKKPPGTSASKSKQKKPIIELLDKNFLSAFECVNDSVYIIDLKGNFVYINQIAHECLGYTNKKMMSMNISKINTPEFAAKIPERLKYIKKHGMLVFDSAHIRKDGTVTLVEVNTKLINLHGQKFFFSVNRDITERKKNDELYAEITKRKQSEKILSEKEKRFRAAATSTADLIWEGDVRNDMLTWFGDIDGLLGYEIGEFPRTVSGHMENILPDDRSRLIKSIESSLKTGSDFKASYRILCKDGTHRYWDERGKAIEFEKGKAVKWVGSVTDITERKQSEKTLIKSENKFRKLTEEFNALLNAIPDDLILLKPDMKIQWANRAFANKFKKKASELYGEYCYQLCCNLSTTCNNCPAVKSFKSGKEEATRVMNSEGRILDKRAFPIPDESGKVKNVIEVARDITANVRMEEEAKLVQSKLIHANKMTSLGTLVSGVAHEINNPNSFILHNAGTLTKIWEDAFKVLAGHHNDKGDLKLANISFPELQTLVPELLNGINEGSVRINNIVKSLRDFARPEKGSMDEKVNLNTVIMTSRSILDNHIKDFTDSFSIDCCSDIPLIRGSVQKIEQVVINIIMNALQSLPDRKSNITISTSHNKRSNEVIIIIKDEGIGIPDSILQHITEPFFTTRFDSGGTGLGLSISYGIVKEHKGSMEFKSVTGSGTTVSTRFPAIK